jgi:hypothetical protein
MRGLVLLMVPVAGPNPVRGADDPKDVRKELAKLQGTWQLVSAETDGKKAVAKEIPFRIDPTKQPKTVDDLLPGGQSILGMYELKGDTLRSCVAPAGKERPTRFAAEAGSGHTLRVFRRVNDTAK